MAESEDPVTLQRPKESVRVYHSNHDLRETYSRENTERRRQTSHTLRRFLTAKQDKMCMNKMTKFRDSHEVANCDDVVILYAQMLIADGKDADLDPELVAIAKQATIAERAA
ncbi:MAG: hypothetical protein ACPGQL_02260 [Thermoplasmatota archaeon]